MQYCPSDLPVTSCGSSHPKTKERMSFLVLCDLRPSPHGLNVTQDLALGQQKKLYIAEVNKGMPQSQRKSLSREPANMMATARHAAVGGVLVVQIYPVVLTYTMLLPNCSLHGNNISVALKFYA